MVTADRLCRQSAWSGPVSAGVEWTSPMLRRPKHGSSVNVYRYSFHIRDPTWDTSRSRCRGTRRSVGREVSPGWVDFPGFHLRARVSGRLWEQRGIVGYRLRGTVRYRRQRNHVKKTIGKPYAGKPHAHLKGVWGTGPHSGTGAPDHQWPST
jgi:hypothetical protein